MRRKQAKGTSHATPMDTQSGNESYATKEAGSASESQTMTETADENEPVAQIESILLSVKLPYPPFKGHTKLTCKHGRYWRSCAQCVIERAVKDA